MGLKSIWAQTNSWLRTQKLSKAVNYKPAIDNEGLISQDVDSIESADQERTDRKDQVIVKTVRPKNKPESLEKLQNSFDNLIGQLKGINEHLGRQTAQHENLMDRINQMPELLESFPSIVASQGQLTEQLIEQLKAAAAKNQQFIEAVGKIPTETAKQTDALANIDHQLAASADTDVQMAENFNKFNEILAKLDQSTIGQTDGIMQMSKTFSTSDRYLKYLMSRQNRRFMWIFMTAIGVCVMAILILTGIIIYLRQ